MGGPWQSGWKKPAEKILEKNWGNSNIYNMIQGIIDNVSYDNTLFMEKIVFIFLVLYAEMFQGKMLYVIYFKLVKQYIGKQMSKTGMTKC